MKIEEDVYDVIIVGAGPCGLATAARLREHCPAALFTDEEHRRYHWIRKYGNKVTLKHVKSGKVSAQQTTKPQYRMLVLDASGDKWLSRWNRLFKAYGITHLRSPVLWHVDPQDRDALRAHAWHNGREDELLEIKHCVGLEISKHAKKKARAGHSACGNKQDARISINLRERNDYYNPSQALFSDHCANVAKRYKLDSDMVRHEALTDLDYGVVNGISINDEKLFTVTTGATRRYARAVVLAVGPANTACIPSCQSMSPSLDAHMCLPQACHSMYIKNFPDPSVQAKIDKGTPTNVVVLGGGLTSAQLSDLAVRKGVTKVWHIMRSPLRVKHFDVDLPWLGKYKNNEQSRFWSADSDEERLAIIKEARGGGSVNQTYNKRLQKHIASREIELRTSTKLVDAIFDDAEGGGKWKLQFDPPVPELPTIDYIYFATGVQTNFETLPYLQKIMEKHPIQGYGGFPCINNDLMWNDDVPLFAVGRLAALRLGPAAPNLGGALIGAERVAWALERLQKDSGWTESEHESSEAAREYHLAGYASGHSNMYSALACE